MLRWVYGAAVLLVPGCFRPDYDHTACIASDGCPSGFTCYAGSNLCVPICEAPADGSVTRVETANASFSNGCLYGSWSLQAPNGMTIPDVHVTTSNTVPVPPSSLPHDALDPSSMYAIHVTGSGQSQSGGGYAHLFLSLNAPPGGPMGAVDASAFIGVQFNAILDAPSGVNFAVGDLDTDSAFGSCTLNEPTGSRGCGDRPRTPRPDGPISVWVTYQHTFGELVQLGTGNQTTTGANFPKSAITVLEWEIAIPGTDPVGPWELWIDDVKFY